MKKPFPNHAMRWSEVKRPIVCLAPMDGVTNSAYRQIVRSLNRGVFLFSEFTSVDGLVQNEFLRSRMDYNPSEHPFFMQLFGCLLYTSPSPRDQRGSRMPSSA